jgi:zinc transporter ZupT
MPDLQYSILLGLAAGFIPVYLGLVPLPLFRRLSASNKGLLISFSVGVLLFLFVEVTRNALDLAKFSATGPVLFTLGLILGLGGPAVVTYRRRTANGSGQLANGPGPTKLFTAYMIAVGIGLHNFGEGLALGAAYAAGQLALTTILVIGFALHNGTEGMGISGPISDVPIRVRQPLLLGFLAGFPTILGSVVGSFAYSQLVGSLFFSAAAGALLYVVMELMKLLRSPSGSFVGISVGFVAMYLTDLLLSV